MKLEQLNSKTINKIHVHLENKQNLAKKVHEKRIKINDLHVEYELEEQTYLTDFNDGALKRMTEIKKEIAVLEGEILELETFINKGNRNTLTLTDADRAEVVKVFAKASEKRDKLFNEFLKKKEEVVAAFKKLEVEQREVDELFFDIVDLVEINLGREERAKLKPLIPHKTNGDIRDQVRELNEQCSAFNPER